MAWPWWPHRYYIAEKNMIHHYWFFHQRLVGVVSLLLLSQRNGSTFQICTSRHTVPRVTLNSVLCVCKVDLRVWCVCYLVVSLCALDDVSRVSFCASARVYLSSPPSELQQVEEMVLPSFGTIFSRGTTQGWDYDTAEVLRRRGSVWSWE